MTGVVVAAVTVAVVVAAVAAAVTTDGDADALVGWSNDVAPDDWRLLGANDFMLLLPWSLAFYMLMQWKMQNI